MAEELIYSIEFLGTDKSIAAINTLDASIAELTTQVNALQTKKKEGIALTEQETKQLIEQKAQLKALQSDRQQQERQLINLNKSLNANNKSYNELTTAVNAAKARLKELPIDQTSEEFRKLQQFVANGTSKLKEFDKELGDNQRNVGNYPNSFNAATASIKDLEQEITRLNEVASNLDINSEEFKNVTASANELQTTILQATGKIDEFGNREPKNQTKKAFDDAADSAAGLVAGVQLVSLALGDEENAEKAAAAATKATAIATNFMLLLKAKEAIVDTAAVAIKRIKIFLFGEELAATTALNTQTVLYAVYQRAAAAATAVATAASTAFGVSVGVATGGISILLGLLAAAAATFVSFGSKAATAELDLSSATAETNKKLKEQQDLIDGLNQTNVDIEIDLKPEGLEKDLAKLEQERLKARVAYEEEAGKVIGALYGVDEKNFREFNEKKFKILDDIDKSFAAKKEDAIKKDAEDKAKEIEDAKKKADELKKIKEQEIADEKDKANAVTAFEREISDEITKINIESAKDKAKLNADAIEDLAKRAAKELTISNARKADEKAAFDLSQKLRVEDSQLYFEYLESGYSTFAEFEKKKLDDQKKAVDEEQANRELIDKIVQASIQATGEIAAAAFQAESDRVAENKDKKIKALQEEKDKGLITEAQFNQKLGVINKAAGEEFKKLKRGEALINFALELGSLASSAAANPLNPLTAGGAGLAQYAIQAALATVRLGINLATINQQKFNTGGLVQGAGSGTSDSIPALLSNGESVMTARATAMFAPLLSRLNVMGGGRAFAQGGPVSPSALSLASDNFTRGQAFNVINNRIDRMRVYQVESEVSQSQARVSTIESEATW